MKIAGVQFKPLISDKEKNLDTIIYYSKNTDSDLIIFPELATSGYFFTEIEKLIQLAETFPGDFSQTIQRISTDMNKIIIYGFPELHGDKIFNSVVAVFPDSSYNKVYRKTHLFYKEHLCFTKGDTGFFVINYPDMDLNLGMMICYDWRFPESARSLALKGADLIVCPSNLVTNIWHKVMPARAIENKVYFALINRIGKENNGDEELFFNGESAIYGYNGERLSVAGVEDENVIYAEIYPYKTRNKSFNQINDIFKDRRPELYNL